MAGARDGGMGLFLSTVTHKVDATGRVAVPAHFRAGLGEADADSFVCFPSFTHVGIEALTVQKITEIAERLDREFNPFDDQGDAFAQSILASCYELPIDREGQVMLPDDLLEHAGLEDYATFVGLGHRFQIWDPDAYQEYAEEARQVARQSRSRFGAAGRPGADGLPLAVAPAFGRDG